MKVLIVDDDAVDRSLIRKNIGTKPSEIVEAKNTTQASEALNNVDFDVIILDYYLPTSTGLTLLKELSSQIGGAAVVFVSHVLDDDIADSCIEAGAQDYLCKSEITPSRLGNAIRHSRQRAAYRQGLVQANKHKS